MKRIILWILFGAIALALLGLDLAGPQRLYGLLGSEACEGTVAAVQPTGCSDADMPEKYLVEIRTDDGQLHVFTSSDRQWMLVSRHDRVRARLFPAPPWSDGEARWRNGVLVTKLHRKPGSPDKDKPGSPDKERSLVGPGSLAVALMMIAIFVRRYNAHRNR